VAAVVLDNQRVRHVMAELISSMCAREAVRLALLGPDGPTGTFSHATLGAIPW
jgi:hypothetical protein